MAFGTRLGNLEEGYPNHDEWLGCLVLTGDHPWGSASDCAPHRPLRHSHLHLQDANALWMRYGYVAMEYMYMYIQRNPYGRHGGVGAGYSRRISALFTPLVLGVTTNPKLDL